MNEEYRIEFANVIKMDDENVEKFKKLYGEGRLSFSQIIPEVQGNESDKEWFDNSEQDALNFIVVGESELIGKSLAKWRLDHWGTPSDLLYKDGPSLQTLEGLLKGEYQFFTRCKPPIKVYEKMAADGLVFETEWRSSATDKWTIGTGQVENGQFQYHIGPATGSEEMFFECVAKEFLDFEGSWDNTPTIVAKNREHLDQLILRIQEHLKEALYTQKAFGLIREISENTIILDNVFDLNFIDVSNVTDLSNLFANFDISPRPEDGWFCKIKLDISKWNIPNVTKEAFLHDNKRVDLVNLSK